MHVQLEHATQLLVLHHCRVVLLQIYSKKCLRRDSIPDAMASGLLDIYEADSTSTAEHVHSQNNQ